MGPTIHKTSPSPPGSRKYIIKCPYSVHGESVEYSKNTKKEKTEIKTSGLDVSNNEASAGIETAVNLIPWEPKGKAMRLLNSNQKKDKTMATYLLPVAGMGIHSSLNSPGDFPGDAKATEYRSCRNL